MTKLPFNGSGVYTLPAGNPVVTGTVISSTVQNNTMADVATALTDCVTRDGQSPATANVPMGGFRITGLGNATARTDAVSAGQLQDGGLTALSAVAGTDTITATSAPITTAYTAGQAFDFIAAGTNTTNTVTLNINGLGAKAVTKYGALVMSPGDIVTGQTVRVRYDGTQFQLISPTSVSSPIPLSNKIVNGNFDIWQRGISFTNATTPANAYTADCWQVNRPAFVAGYTVTRQTGPVNSQFAIRIQRTAGDTNVAGITAATSFETADITKWQGRTFNHSFQALANGAFIGQTLTVLALFGTGTDGSVAGSFTGLFGTITNTTAALTGAYQTFNFPIAIPSNATQMGLTVSITPSGTAGAADYFQLAQQALTDGAAQIPFERRSVSVERNICKNYFNVMAFYFPGSAGGAGNTIGGTISFPDMRVAPTGTLTGVTQTNCTGGVVNGITTNQMQFSAAVTAIGGYIFSGAVTLNASL